MAKFIVIFVIFTVFCSFCEAQVQFEVSETNKNKQPTKHNRQPLESDKCMEGEYLYPGDNDKDWACDCKPTFVYHPESLKCYPVFSQGPCKKKEILVLPPKKVIPICQSNRCPDNQIYYLNRCARLNENGGCPRHLKLQINATSLELTCALNLDSRFGEDDAVNFTNEDLAILPVDSNGAFCAVGGKRSQDEKCGNSNPV